MELDIPDQSNIVIDALNFLTEYFCPNFISIQNIYEVWDKVIYDIEKNIINLIKAAQSKNLTLHFVIDAGFQTTETKKKWILRRENEVRQCSRILPLETDTILSEILRKYHQLVYLPVGFDADDIVVKLAILYQGYIVSRDRDMYRYIDFDTSKIIYNFIINNNDIKFLKGLNSFIKKNVSLRNTSSIPLLINEWKKPHNKLTDLIYLRGCCSPMTKQYGNIQSISSPLRSIIYEFLEIKYKDECWPEWCPQNNKVIWINYQNKSKSNSKLKFFFKQPYLLLKWLEDNDPSYLQFGQEFYQEHPIRIFARIITCSLLYSILANESILDILETLKPVEHKQCQICYRNIYFNKSHLEWYQQKGFCLPNKCSICKKIRS